MESMGGYLGPVLGVILLVSGIYNVSKMQNLRISRPLWAEIIQGLVGAACLIFLFLMFRGEMSNNYALVFGVIAIGALTDSWLYYNAGKASP